MFDVRLVLLDFGHLLLLLGALLHLGQFQGLGCELGTLQFLK